jgi:hypothetical protein
MSPKNTLHGGPSHEGDPPPPRRRSFGAALSEAREEPKPEVVAEQPTPLVRIVVDYQKADATLLEFVRYLVRSRGWYLEGDTGPELPVEPGSGSFVTGPADITEDGPAEVYETGGVLNQPFYVGEQGPESMSAADLERLGQQQPAQGIEVPVAGTEHELTTEVEGGESPSAGTSSSTSPKKPKTSNARTKAPSRSRARTTGSRSKQDPPVDSTADSAAAPTTSSDES